MLVYSNKSQKDQGNATSIVQFSLTLKQIDIRENSIWWTFDAAIVDLFTQKISNWRLIHQCIALTKILHNPQPSHKSRLRLSLCEWTNGSSSAIQWYIIQLLALSHHSKSTAATLEIELIHVQGYFHIIVALHFPFNTRSS